MLDIITTIIILLIGGSKMIQGIILIIGLVVIMILFTIYSIIKLFFPEKESQKKIQQPTVIDIGAGSWVWIPKVEESRKEQIAIIMTEDKLTIGQKNKPKKPNILQKAIDKVLMIVKYILIIIGIITSITTILLVITNYIK